MRWVLGVLAVVIALGASDAANARTPSSGIAGRIVSGPTCPVVSVPPGPGCAPAPLVAVLRISRVGGGVRAVRVTSNARGTFRVPLAPGTYLIRAVARAGFPLPRPPADQRVRVRAGRFTLVQVSYDTGIR